VTNTAVASIGELRDRLAAVVATVLRVPAARVSRLESFTSLGMDSLAAVELTAAIEDELGIELSLSAVHEHPDLDSLSDFIERGSDDGAPARRRDRLIADAVLPAGIQPSGLTPVPTRDARSVLLTGATGFVGAFLLRTLLDETAATVHCLVRPGPTDGFTRVRRNLTRYRLWSDGDAERLRVVHGDIRRPLFGLGTLAWSELAGDVDVVYHAAADVNWVHAYETLRDANVVGTRELLRFACEGTPKPFHFLSSASVCHAGAGPRFVDERFDAMPTVDGLHLGYAQSKCVAEALVRETGERGLPVTIIRPSLVTGDGIHGRSNVDDITSRFIAGCIRMHAAPDLDWRMDCVPVDDVARAVVRLAAAHERGVRVSHIVAPRPRHWRECVLWMRLSGYDVDLLPYGEWADRLRGTDDASHPLHGLRAFFLHGIAAENHLTLPELFEESRRPRVVAPQTNLALATLGAAVGALDSGLLSRYFDDFISHGAVPPAPRRSSAPPVAANRDILASVGALATGLGDWLGIPSPRIDAVTLTPLASDESIVAELTAWRANTCAGLFQARVSLTGRGGTRREVPLFLKAKTADAQTIEVAEALAALASPDLGCAVTRFRDDLGLTRSHLREIALYDNCDSRLRGHMPRPVLVERDDSRKRWLVALEWLDDAWLTSAADTTHWTDAVIETTLDGLAQIHSVWFHREGELAREPWLAPPRTAGARVAMTPLWTALAAHARDRSAAWDDHRLRRIHDKLIDGVAGWARALDTAPRTLIHNDFNPRNIAIRRGPDQRDARLCAFDWELAALGVPQRDLAELLCFVLPPDAPLATIAKWIEHYRVALANATGESLARSEWEGVFSAALCDLLADRLAFYAMVDRVRPQQFLPRVVRTWLNLFRHFPWTG